MSCIFMSCIFMSCIVMPCHMVRQFHVLQFSVDTSSPAIGNRIPIFWCMLGSWRGITSCSSHLRQPSVIHHRCQPAHLDWPWAICCILPVRARTQNIRTGPSLKLPTHTRTHTTTPTRQHPSTPYEIRLWNRTPTWNSWLWKTHLQKLIKLLRNAIITHRIIDIQKVLKQTFVRSDILRVNCHPEWGSNESAKTSKVMFVFFWFCYCIVIIMCFKAVQTKILWIWYFNVKMM